MQTPIQRSNVAPEHPEPWRPWMLGALLGDLSLEGVRDVVLLLRRDALALRRGVTDEQHPEQAPRQREHACKGGKGKDKR